MSPFCRSSRETDVVIQIINGGSCLYLVSLLLVFLESLSELLQCGFSLSNSLFPSPISVSLTASLSSRLATVVKSVKVSNFYLTLLSYSDFGFPITTTHLSGSTNLHYSRTTSLALTCLAPQILRYVIQTFLLSYKYDFFCFLG